MEDLQEIKTLLSRPSNILISSHRNPDGDALGSSLALSHYLQQLGHKVVVVTPSEYPHTFKYLPQVEDIKIYDVHSEMVDPFIDTCDVIFALDYNGLDRIDRLGQKIATTKAKIIMIDHHLDPEPFYHYALSDTSASSTAELVYEFINHLGDSRFIGPDIATCIMTGLITDTGSFKYNTRPATFICAAKMQERGIDVKDIQDEIFNSMKIKQMKLLAHALSKRMEILEEYSTAIIVLNKYDYANFDIQRGDTEGIVNYLLMMKDIKLAAFITQQPQIVKISLRSKGDISAQQMARDHFRGGGHKNAAGGALYGSLTKVIDKFKEVLPQYMEKKEIQNNV